MAKTSTKNQDLDKLLEERKVKALEKIANSLDVLLYGLKKSIKKIGAKN